MVNKDSRIEASFNGYTATGDILFTDRVTSKYISMTAVNVSGSSILEVGVCYQIRQLPGDHYIVEGKVSECAEE